MHPFHDTGIVSSLLQLLVAMRCQRFAMTLVEWLVVVVCVGILLGLLLPAINIQRRPPRRHQCAAHLRNLALAAIQYENANGEFPGYVMDFGTWNAGQTPMDPSNPEADPSDLVRHRKIGTWAVAILPWLDAQPTYEHWTDDRFPIAFSGSQSMPLSSGESGEGFAMLAAPNLAIYQCPANPCGDATHGRNSYICNAGMYHRGPGGAPAWQIDRAGVLVTIDFARSMAKANGVFNNKVSAIDVAGNSVSVGPAVSLADLTDGQAYTMLFSENLQAMPWHRAGLIDAQDLVVAEGSSQLLFEETSRYTQGMVWHFEDRSVENALAVNPVHRINGPPSGKDVFVQRMNARNAPHLARPSSAHIDGVNAAMADGSTRFISSTTDYRIYQALLTPNGERSDVPFPEFEFSDDSLWQ